MSQTSDELQAQLLAKALEDESFRQTLLTSPKTAIADELGVELPGDLDVEVLEETPNKLYLVLPMRAQEGELDDDALENVAGGVIGDTGMGPMINTGLSRLKFKSRRGDV